MPGALIRRASLAAFALRATAPRLIAGALWLAVCGWSALSASQATPAAVSAVAPTDVRATIEKYCVTCHNQRLKTGNLALDAPELTNVAGHAEVWEKVIRKVRAGMMPPAGLPRPDAASRSALVASLESTLDTAARANPNPGRPLAHRLNRAEYANAVRDLLALDVDVTSMLPPDDSSGGFDNNADVLGVSPVLLESYLTAAERISALALGDPKTPPIGELFRVRQDESQDRHIEGLPLGTIGGIQLHTTLPLDGEYQFQVRLFRTNLGTTRGLEYPHQLEISVDGVRVHLASFGGDKEIAASSDNPTTTGDAVDNRFTARVPLKAGPRTITIAFLEKTHALNTRRLENYQRSSSDTIDFSGSPHIDEVILTGPFNPSGSGDTPSRRRIFTCNPPSPAAAPNGASARLRRDQPADSAGWTRAEEEQCAQKILAGLARRAYRADVTRDDSQALLAFFKQGRADGGSFESGIDLALRRLMTSPKFIFRVEREPADVRAGGVYRLGDPALAARLSFFLWSAPPDEELLDLAEKGRLSTPATFERQVRRMLSNPKSQSLIDNFLAQWLQLRNLKGKQPNSHEFPDFDDNLREALQTEIEMFVSSIIREDRSVMDVLTADYTFVNERLAKHYGIPYVYGTHFRRVTLQDDVRRGLLGKGALLMVTSHPHRTSPVLRGKWILENVLGAPPPGPPDVVPPFEESTEASKPKSVRERMENHRRNPACASCHRMIDPAGLALENFDAVGAWRTRDGGTRGTPIDASGQLVDGTQINGVNELRAALVRDPNVFVQALTERLLTYALGRGLTAADMPAVRTIARDAQRENYRFSSVVLGIVRSVPFQMRIKGAADEATRVAGR